MNIESSIEEQILEAAERVFYQKGKQGASMQAIADEAGITRTSLNYYYRTKDKLFDAVFRRTMEQFVPEVAALMKSGQSMEEKLSGMVEMIVDTILARPQIPVFVLQELTSNPGRVPEVISSLGLHTGDALQSLEEEVKKMKLSIDPRHLVVNVLGLAIYPFAARPIIISVMYKGDEDAYIRAMQERKALLPMMIRNMIKTWQT